MSKTTSQKARETEVDALLKNVKTNFKVDELLDKAKKIVKGTSNDAESETAKIADLYGKLNYLKNQIDNLRKKVSKEAIKCMELQKISSIKGIQIITTSAGTTFDKAKAIKKLEEIGEDVEANYSKPTKGKKYLGESKDDETVKN